MKTRRQFLLLMTAGRILYARDGEFWNRKDPSDWSSDEVDRLITKSPWAKEITASAPHTGSGRGGLSIPGIGVGRRGNRTAPTATPHEGIVRWESAKPVLEALKESLPAELAGHYVISVNGIPFGLPRADSEATGADSRARQRELETAIDRIKGQTYLESKGAGSTQPGIVQETPFGVGETRSLLFGFSKSLLNLTLEDKEVAFTTHIGAAQVKAHFNLKEMIYRNELAL